MYAILEAKVGPVKYYRVWTFFRWWFFIVYFVYMSLIEWYLVQKHLSISFPRSLSGSEAWLCPVGFWELHIPRGKSCFAKQWPTVSPSYGLLPAWTKNRKLDCLHKTLRFCCYQRTDFCQQGKNWHKVRYSS